MSKDPLLIATSNEGKLRELREMLSDLPFELIGLTSVSSLQPVPETGSTFVENATLKAIGYARQSAVLTLADDSGLLIDVLNGAPGVLSARYLGESTSYAARNGTLLNQLEEKVDRTARFVCAVAIAGSNAELLNVFEKTCEGSIAESPRGSGGFGYDPIFVPAGYDQTFAELPSDIKNGISHRGRAIAAARDYLATLTSAQTAR